MTERAAVQSLLGRISKLSMQSIPDLMTGAVPRKAMNRWGAECSKVTKMIERHINGDRRQPVGDIAKEVEKLEASYRSIQRT